MIRFAEDICTDFEAAAGREWLETNGLGGYASSTVAGANTRRYHGLLVAALRPPGARTVLVSKIEDALQTGYGEYDLSCNQYPDTVYPQGYRHIAEFRADPFPTWVYRAKDATLVKSVLMVHAANLTVVRYRLVSGPDCTLTLRPLVTCRDHHHLLHESADFNGRVELRRARDMVRMKPFAAGPEIYLWLPGGRFEERGDWYRRFEYVREKERGLDYREDLYSPGYFACAIAPGQSICLVLASDDPSALCPDRLVVEEQERRARLAASAPQGAPEVVRSLWSAADAFVVRSSTGRRGIIAGYHWFGEWGRDTMITVGGLLLATGRLADAGSVLLSYASYINQGLIPNCLGEADAPSAYNAADASLWYVLAVGKFRRYGGDPALVRDHLYPPLVQIIEGHLAGTRYGIRVEPNGLLRQGEPGVQLTWMDAKVGDRVVTPRQGKAVEIGALWYNALRTTADLARECGERERAERYEEAAAAAHASFEPTFWFEEGGYLYDCVDGEHKDMAVRPNQVFAVSLPYPLLPREKERSVVARVERELLTSFGLRTLCRRHPSYVGAYGGDQAKRDAAYHQGTVWPWLLGHFISAYVKVHDGAPEARERARGWIEGSREHLSQAGLGFISEIFDGDPPHRPNGCIAQAWSVSEWVRAWVEDVEGRWELRAQVAGITESA